jgi:endogenous inhibitor of DNA gyrase (YacG/DUF329 family)
MISFHETFSIWIIGSQVGQRGSGSSGNRILWKRYIIRSFGLIWVTQASCGTCTTACIWKEKFIQKKFMKFALCTLGWNSDIELPPYCQRCRLIDLDVLGSRRRVLCALYICDVLNCKLDCPIILSSLRLSVYLYNTWYRFSAQGRSSPNELWNEWALEWCFEDI